MHLTKPVRIAVTRRAKCLTSGLSRVNLKTGPETHEHQSPVFVTGINCFWLVGCPCHRSGSCMRAVLAEPPQQAVGQSGDASLVLFLVPLLVVSIA